MIISDLNHLETVAEAPSIVGGSFNINVKIIKKSADVDQYSKATAYADAYKGDAYAKAYSSNGSYISQ